VPDSKVSDLTELAATPAADDELVVVDKSDTTQAASGTTKRLRADRLYSMPGNVTLGDDSGDTLTVNAGTWTLGSNYVATRAAGELAAGTVEPHKFVTTFSGDAGGTTSGRALTLDTTASGANSLGTTVGLQVPTTLSTSAGTTTGLYAGNFVSSVAGAGSATSVFAINQNVTVSSTGNVTNAFGANTSFVLSGAGNITTATGFNVPTPIMSSTGAFTTLTGFNAANLGHATLVTNALGFDHADFTGSATLTVGYRSQMSSGTGKWAFLSTGTAASALAGSTRFGSNVAPTETVHVTGTLATSGINALGTTTSATTNLNLPAGAHGRSAVIPCDWRCMDDCAWPLRSDKRRNARTLRLRPRRLRCPDSRQGERDHGADLRHRDHPRQCDGGQWQRLRLDALGSHQQRQRQDPASQVRRYQHAGGTCHHGRLQRHLGPDSESQRHQLADCG
jgi:hypothetical protein